MAFEDEEWQGIVLPKTVYVNYVTTKLTSYSSPMWFMTNLYTWLGPNFSLYFLLSFLLRVIVAFSSFVFLYIFTKDRLSSFLGGVLIAVGFSGIQTTFETINMISYISYIGWLVFLCAFFLIQNKVLFRYLITMGISLSVATFIGSFRIYPLYAWVIMADGLRALMHFKKGVLKIFLVRQLVVIAVFLLLYKIGIFSWYSRDASSNQSISDLDKFSSDSGAFLASLNSKVIVNFVKGIGNVIVPDIFDRSGNINLFIGVTFIIFLISLFLYAIKKRTSKTYLLLIFFIWPLLFYASYFLVYINGFASKETAILQSSMRYLYPPFIGFSIAVAFLLSAILKKNKNWGRKALIFMLIYISIHAVTTHFYLSNLSKQRDGAYMVRVWEQIKRVVPITSLNTKKENVFYFETDGSARAIYTINDGFIGHAIAVYKVDNKPAKFDATEIGNFGRLIAPPIIAYEGLIDYIKKDLTKDSEDAVWDRIFAFRVINGTVIDIKEDVKVRVEESLKNDKI